MENKPLKSSAPAYKLWFSLLLGVPLAALIAFSSLLVLEKRDVLLEMNELDTSSHLISQAGDVVHEVQRERGYTSGFIASKGKQFKTEVILQRAVTDEEFSRFLKGYSSAKKNAVHAGIINNLGLAVAELGKLNGIRAGIDSLQIGYFDGLTYYSKINSLMLDSVAFFPQLIADKEISSLYLAYYHLQQVKEKAGLQRAALTYAFESGKFLPGQFGIFLGMVSDESYSRKRFLSLAPPDIKESYLKISALREVAQSDWMKQIATEKGVEGNFGVEAVHWNAMQTAKIDKISEICDLLENRVMAVVDARHAEARSSLIMYLVVNIAIIAFTLSMAVLLFQNMAKRREAEESLALHAKRMENALFRAKDVLSAIATSPEIVPFFTVSPVYRTMRSIGGGDIVKWARFRSQYAGLYLHDVAGHDIEEILLNILAASLVDICKTNPAKKSVSIPSVFLDRMNEHLTKYCEGRPDYLTAVYLLMDFEERNIKMAEAGHPRPWLINSDGTVRQLDMPAGFILGQFTVNSTTDERYRDFTFHLETGQLLLVYSDGLMEQVDAGGKTFEAKFSREIGPKLAGLEPRAAYRAIKREFEDHLDGLAPEDDVSFILVGTRPAGKYETVRFVPGPELMSLIARHKSFRDDGSAPLPTQDAAKSDCHPPAKPGCAVMHKLSDSYRPVIEKLKSAQWADKRVGEVELTVSEMIINAIMHGNMLCNRCTVELSYILHDDELEICVTDEGSGFDSKTLPQSVEGTILKEGGRGHHMISAMADGLYFNDAGNRCWSLFHKNA